MPLVGRFPISKGFRPFRRAISGLLAALQKLRVPLPSIPSPRKSSSPCWTRSLARDRRHRRCAIFRFRHRGSLPASVAANWLSGAWDQNGAFVVGPRSPRPRRGVLS
jgi:hypothetical protein